MYKINLFEIDLDIVRRLGINKVKENCILPIKIQDDTLIVLSDKDSLKNKDELEFIYNKKLNIKEMKAETQAEKERLKQEQIM